MSTRQDNLETQNRGFSRQPQCGDSLKFDGEIEDFTVEGLVMPTGFIPSFLDVLKERLRQCGQKQPGKVEIDWRNLDRLNSRNDWSSYITRYTGRATDERAPIGWCPQDFRNNMVKVAATALAAIQAYDAGAACSYEPK